MKKILSGNEAIAQGAYEAGVSFAVGYPGTPSTEILENLVNYKQVKCQWSPNEKVALEVGMGAAFVGARVLVTMKHVGVNVAADPLMSLSYTGIKGGLVLISADDPELHSSQNEQDNRNYAKFAKIPCIEPSDSSEAKEFLKVAYTISEQFDTPVLFRITTRIAHTRTVVNIEKRKKLNRKLKFDKCTSKYVMIPAYGRAKHKYIEERLKKITSYSEKSRLNKIEKVKTRQNKKIGIIATGVVYNYVREIITDIDILKLGIIYPFPEKLVRKFCKNKTTIYVIEELDPFLETELIKLKMDIKIIGKEMFPITGELTPDLINRYFYKKKLKSNVYSKNMPMRPPVLCSGCPHRAVFTILKKLKVIVTGDIGCYTLGVLPPFNMIDTCVCMGAGIGHSIGMINAVGKRYEKKVVAVIGDSTFIHSGITGIIDAIYNKTNNTTIIMDNSITAMTGHQDHPGTGKTLSGSDTIALDYKKLALSIGYSEDSVDVVNPINLKAFESTVKKHLKLSKPSIVISKSPCALLNKKTKNVYFKIDEKKCTQCNNCIEISCPAIIKKGKQPFIVKDLCVACSVCKQVCPNNAINAEKR